MNFSPLKGAAIDQKNSEIIGRISLVFNFEISKEISFILLKNGMSIYKLRRWVQKSVVFLSNALIFFNKNISLSNQNSKTIPIEKQD